MYLLALSTTIPHGWEAQLFFYLFSWLPPSRRYHIAPYCNFRNFKNFKPYLLFERFTLKFAFIYSLMIPEDTIDSMVTPYRCPGDSSWIPR